MKHPILFSTLFILLVTGCQTALQRSEKEAAKKMNTVSDKLQKEVPKYAVDLFKGMTLIHGGGYTMGIASDYTAEKNDSTLLPRGMEHRVTVSSFYMSNHEVTNGEYREFVGWVRDSIALSLLAKHDSGYYLPGTRYLNWSKRGEIWTNDSAKLAMLKDILSKEENRYYRTPGVDASLIIYTWSVGDSTKSLAIYPDTLCFYKEYKYSFNEPMTQMYFWHPKYTNYPVVGVSWHQANAYCAWLKARYRQELAASGKHDTFIIDIRLPKEVEWEYAALAYARNSFYTERIIPWGGYDIRDKEGNYLANSGPAYDRNWLALKQYSDDGAIFPARAANYPANNFGLYDMAGNVAEWTLDNTLGEDSLYFAYQVENAGLYRKYEKEVNEIRQTTRLRGDETRDSAKQKILSRFLQFNELLRQDTSSGSTNEKDISNRHTGDTASVYIDDFAYKKVPVKSRTDSAFAMQMAEKLVDAELQYARAHLLNPSSRIVKGGSWATGPAYMQCGAREIFPESRSSSRIGFRVVVIVPHNPVGNSKRVKGFSY